MAPNIDDPLPIERSRSPFEIGPAPVDDTGLWIRLGLAAVAALILLRLVGRARRAG